MIPVNIAMKTRPNQTMKFPLAQICSNWLPQNFAFRSNIKSLPQKDDQRLCGPLTVVMPLSQL